MTRVVVVGHGMVGSRFAGDLAARCGGSADVEVTVLGAEEHEPYNRVLLSEVVAGRADLAAIALPATDDPRVTVRRGTEALAIDRASRRVLTGEGAYPYDVVVLATGAAQPFAPDVVDTYRTVMRIPFAAHTAMESLRWAVRSTPRPDGRRFLAALRHPVEVPALQVHAARDGLLRRDLADADGAALARDFRFEVVDDAGHFLPEEAPGTVTDLLLDWLPTTQRPAG